MNRLSPLSLLVLASTILASAAHASGVNGTFPEIPDRLNCEIERPYEEGTDQVLFSNILSETKIQWSLTRGDRRGFLSIQGDDVELNFSISDSISYLALSMADIKRLQADEVSWIPAKMIYGYDYGSVHLFELQATCTQ